MPYLGNDLSVIVQQSRVAYKYIATSGQTAFTGNDANGFPLEVTTNSFVSVFLNGVRLIKTDDYTVNTNTITLITGATLNDELLVVVDTELSTTTSYTKSETDTIVQGAIDNLVDAAPGALDTLNELAAALNDDASFATTVTNSLATKVAKTSATGSAQVPVGTEAQRDGSPSAGYFRFNSDSSSFEGYNGTAWGAVGGGATGAGGDAVFYENDQTVTTNYTITAGKNAMTTGPVIVADGVTVTVPSGSRLVVL
jgi:hypothetical protein